MLKKRYLLLTGLVLSLAGSGCKRIETEPVDIYREDTLWDVQDRNANVASQFLNDLYNYIPNGFARVGGNFFDAGTDDGVPSRTTQSVEFYTNGTISSTSNPDAYWGNSYAGIRKVNIFLANIDKVPANAETVKWWKAEARFIRALMYFELVKRYGGVPLIGDQIFTLQDDLSLSRNTYSECVDYIVKECDAIVPDLRKETIAREYTDNDWGRIPRGAALALKSRMLLYAASPLFNGGGQVVPGSTDLNGYPNADPMRWQKALDAAQEFLNAGYYTLRPSFSSVFLERKNTEIILAKQAVTNTTLETTNAPVGSAAPANSQGLTSPSQNLVDAFPDANGRPITDPATSYQANNPYAGRDPRLLATVFTNGTGTSTSPVGSRWLGRNVELFEGGRDKPNTNGVQTRTGYYLRKFLGDFTSSSAYTNQTHNFPIFRFAEIKLNFAEALNERDRTPEAITQIIDLRRRAGIQAGTDNRFGIPAGISKDATRDLIRNERRIELAFEEHRFWDLRRWRIAETTLNGPLNGIKIVRTATMPLTFTYERTLVTNMVFQPKLYYLPLPYDETTKNLNLMQNPGW
ncbi:RagB/SusD family nutrient uptake outer membrane protein [Hymenobacter sp.]|jgi:hypothetical protein|uniref:RagB/SusD family nutrient uptake outer membrane protein n=1 Tax=Hymenobacter sp. TaxID=1898978 RepID=UPI002ED949DF